jgi:Gram-negative bacterial TonB protein C-terminal
MAILSRRAFSRARKKTMRTGILCLILAEVFLWVPTFGQDRPPKPSPPSSVTAPVTVVPKDTILVKGAWSSASDSFTPVPEGSTFANGAFNNAYFGMSYSLPSGWVKGNEGPPPSDSGRYVLAQMRLPDAGKRSRGSILITAEDLFFTRLPAANAQQLINFTKDNLQANYKLEEPPAPIKIAGRPFAFFAYWSPVAQLHWYVAATEIRCHAVELVLTSRDTKLLKSLLLDLDKITLPPDADPTLGTGGGASPVCIKDYARPANMTARVDPIFTERHANPVPVRLIIDKDGKVKHIHFLSAFPGQAKAVSDALAQWRFNPYMQDGHPVEVETGIMFGRAPPPTAIPGAGASTE